MRIAIIDDERPARSELRHQIQELLKEAEIVEGDSGAAALQIAGDGKYELFFLDINLGDISGTVLVNAIHNMQPQAKIIFVTAYSEYAVEAFELGVEDYVMKPFDQKRIQKVLDKCKIGGKEENEQHAESQSQGKQASIRRLAINSDGRTIIENVEDIVYIETYNRGCKIYTTEWEYCENKSIGEYEKKLDPEQFFRIHKSIIINLDKVREVFPWGSNSFSLRMRGYEDQILPIARDKTRMLKQHLMGL